MTRSRIPRRPELVPVRGESDEQEERALRRALHRSATLAGQSILDLAQFYARTGRQRQAVPWLERLVGFTPDPRSRALALLTLGQLMEQIGDYDAARLYYGRGLDIEQASEETRFFLRNNLGFSLNELGRYEEGERYCRDAIDVDPLRYHAHKNLGLALAGQGRLAEAAESLVLAAELAPDEPRALLHLEELIDEAPQLLEREPWLAEALEECRKLAELRRAALN